MRSVLLLIDKCPNVFDKTKITVDDLVIHHSYICCTNAPTHTHAHSHIHQIIHEKPLAKEISRLTNFIKKKRK